jgi:hypothetical protein
MKVRCEKYRCDWRGQDHEALRAPDPFNEGDELIACPKCREVSVLQVACDEPDCWEFVSCGTPTADGYRRTCHKHAPKEK